MTLFPGPRPGVIAPSEKRMTCPGCAWPWIFTTGQRGRCMQKWITGAQIIKRWSALPFEIYGPMERGELVPVSPEDGTRLTKEVAPCLYCIGGQDDGTGWGTKACRHLGPAETCYDNWRPEKRVQRVAEAIFSFKELLEYEERSGVGPGRPSQEEEDQWLYEENKWFLDEDALGPGERFESRVESQPLQKWFTGAELLPRWDMVIGELVQLLKDGEICPVNEFTLEPRTKDIDPCLYCEGGDPMPFNSSGVSATDMYRSCRLSIKTLCCEWTGAKRIERVLAAKFRGQEILAYEQTHGLVSQSIPTGRDSAKIELFQSGSAGGELEPSITGRELIDRWKGSRMNLFRALRDGDLIPVDTIPLRGEECTKRPTKHLDPCLYCENPSFGKICNLHQNKHTCHRKNDSVRIDRVNMASFLMREVLEYEKKVLAAEAELDHPKVYSTPPTISDCITGEALLVRWRAMPFRLIEAWKNGLGTFRSADGARQVHGRSCLECWGCDGNGFPSCSLNYGYCSRDECDGGGCICDRVAATGGVDVATLGSRLRESFFSLAEVEDYERMVGINSPCREVTADLLPAHPVSLENNEKQEFPSTHPQTEMFEELTKAALLLAGQAQAQDRAVTRAELRQHLVESTSFRDHQISDRILRQVWNTMPDDSKNKGGRPRKTE